MAVIKQSTTYTRMFLMIDSADHFTGKTGLTCTLTLSKAGGAFSAAGGTITEVASGWYKIALTTTDTNTLGDLAYHVTGTGADATDIVDQVAANILGDTLPANTTQLAGQTVTAAAGVTFPTSVASPTNITAGTITTVTTLTNLPAITAGWLTATGIAASALNGKGDWLLSSGYTSPPTSATIAGAVWDVTLSGHLTSGTTGNALNAAGAAGDPWTTAIPGAYGAGTAGNIVGNNLNATVSSRLASASVPTNFASLAITAGGAVTAGTVSDKTGYALTSAYDFAKGTVAMTESYAASTATMTPAQAMYGIHQYLTNFSISGTSYTVTKRDKTTTAFTVTLNDAVSPTAASE